MNLGYVSGFFDADGSITLVSFHKNEQKALQVSLSNNEKDILLKIQSFLFEKYKLKGSISKKPPKNPNHKVNYELKYTRDYALKLIKHLNSFHPQKKYRMDAALKYYKEVTPRNGKYSEKRLTRKAAFNRLFFWKNKKAQ